MDRSIYPCQDPGIFSKFLIFQAIFAILTAAFLQLVRQGVNLL